MSKEEFAKKHCISFQEYSEAYGKLCKARNIDITKAFQNMLDISYNGYARHEKIFDPGRII
jgi:hypothetical protein